MALVKRVGIRSLLALAVLLFVGAWYNSQWDQIRSQPVTAWDSESHADCGIALTGGAGRVKEGFDLLSHKAIRKLIVAGVRPNTSLRELFPLWPFYGDLSEDDVFLDLRSQTTYGNAQQTLPIVEALHCRDVVLVTSSFHMNRAFKTFRAAFPEKISIYQHSIVPSLAENSWTEVAVEILKTSFYSLFAF